MSQLGLAYPLTWAYAVLPGPWAEQFYVAIPFLLCPWFSYLYLREIQRSKPASLLAALSFSYGGLFVPTVNGFLNHGTMWLPLLLLAIERARKISPYVSIPLIAGVYAMSILNGLGQAFVYVGLLAFAYSIFVTFLTRANGLNGPRRIGGRLRPLLVTLGGMSLAMGLTAFQTLETWQAVSLSIRQAISYPTFTEGSFTAYTAWKSFIAPRFNSVDVLTYVPSLAAILAAVGVVAHIFRLKNIERDPRVLFWITVALLAAALMLGGNTPLYAVVYRLPLLNLFRVPARHAFEWTFALSVLSAYGWDVLANSLLSTQSSRNQQRVVATLAALLLTSATGAYWIAHYGSSPSIGSEGRYILVKLIFTLGLLVSGWWCFRIASSQWRSYLNGWTISVACFVEAFILFGQFWYPIANPSSSFTRASQATQFLQQLPAGEGRVYTDGPHVPGRFDSFNMLLLHGMQNLAGYEPALLTRYSRALGNVGPDTLQVLPGFNSEGTLLDPGCQVLNILNTKYLTTFWDLGDRLDQATERDGVKFAATAAPLKLRPRQSASLNKLMASGDTLRLVTSLAYANGLQQGEPVATIRLHLDDGRVVDRLLRAGIDTAEWAHERADIRDTIPHTLAPIFDTAPGDERNTFPAYRYLSTISLGHKERITGISLVNTSGVLISIWKVTVVDSEQHLSTPIPLLANDKWVPLYNNDGVIVLENKQALPHAWLVSETKKVDGEESLLAIRGQAKQEYNLEQTALVESSVADFPSLTGQPLKNSSARVVSSSPNRLMLETKAEAPSFLVVSEIYYPGWVARVDGNETPIYQTDYLLRGIPLPTGAHRVEMQYTAPYARRGLGVSAICAVILGLLVFLRPR